MHSDDICSTNHHHHSSSSSSAEKSFRINHDERFFSKLMAKETSTFGNTSSRVLYYGEKSSGAVPFMWEAQPGTPKHPLSEKSLPPLTPPPSCYSNDNNNSKRIIRNSKLANNIIFSTIWPKIYCSSRKKKGSHNNNNSNNVSLSSSSWSRSSSLSNSSSNLSSLAYSSPSFSMRDRDNHHHHHGNQGRSMSFSGLRSSSSSSSALGSPNNLKQKCSHGGFIRGCYPFGNMKNATL